MASHILFICTGNTCRSPMAEGLFKKAIADHPDIECIGSAGVAAFAGDSISPETQSILKKSDADLNDFRSRAVSDYLLDEATQVFAMTNSHLNMLTQAFPDHAEKCHLICDFVEINGRIGVDLPDPIGMGSEAYKQVAGVIEKAIPGILSHIQSETKQ